MAKLVAPFESFYKLTAEDMYNWLQANKQDEFIEKIKNEAFDLTYPKTAVPVLNPDGTPKMKNYHPIVNGVKIKSWATKPITKMVEDKTQEPKRVYNHHKAKEIFCKEYCPNLLPEKGEPRKKPVNPFGN